MGHITIDNVSLGDGKDAVGIDIKGINPVKIKLIGESKDDIDFNIRLTYSIYGGYYAYNEYCKCGDERINEIIGEISKRVMK